MASHRGKHIVCYHGHSYMSDHFDICLSKASDRKGYTRLQIVFIFEHRPQPRGSVLISLCDLINGAVLFLLVIAQKIGISVLLSASCFL